MYKKFLDYIKRQEYSEAFSLFKANQLMALSWEDYLTLRYNIDNKKAGILDRCFWFPES